MARQVRAALAQGVYPGGKRQMINKHIAFIEEAAGHGAQVICFQELFSSPYFCQVQNTSHFDWAEPAPEGPTTQLLQRYAAQFNMVVIAPLFEKTETKIAFNTAVVIDADGSYLGKYRKTHIPDAEHFREKFYFQPGDLGYPVFETAVGKIGVYICYDRHFPEGARVLGLNGAEIVFIPTATAGADSQGLWLIEPRAHAIANSYFVGAVNRVGVEAEFGPSRFYGQSYFCDPS